jgi:hypothetical protein
MIGEGYVHTVNRIFGLTVFSAIVALTVPAAQADNDAY